MQREGKANARPAWREPVKATRPLWAWQASFICSCGGDCTDRDLCANWPVDWVGGWGPAVPPAARAQPACPSSLQSPAGYPYTMLYRCLLSA